MPNLNAKAYPGPSTRQPIVLVPKGSTSSAVCFLTNPAGFSGLDYWRADLPARRLAAAGCPVALCPLGADIPAINGLPPFVLALNSGIAKRVGGIGEIKRWAKELKCILANDCADDPRRTDDSPFTKDLDVVLGQDQVLRESDLITTTTEHLAEILRRINDNVVVLPSVPDLRDWYNVYPDWGPPKDKFIVGVSGGDTHDKDWVILEKIWTELAKRHEDMHFVLAGHQPSWLARAVSPERVSLLPWRSPTTYQRSLVGWDLTMAPLRKTTFSLSKEPIKAYEAALAGSVFMATKWGPYADLPHAYLLEDNPDDWIEATSAIYRGHARQQQITSRARRWVFDLVSSSRDALHRDAAYVGTWDRRYNDAILH